MKRSYRGVMMLGAVLFFNIIFTQYTVNFYFYEKYDLTVLFALLNVILFPIAVYIYKKEVKANGR